MTNDYKKSLLELKKLNLEQLRKYYLDLRKIEFDNNIPLKGMEIRKKIHILLWSIIKVDRLLSKETLTIIGDQRKKIEKPIIYACTHIGGNDIQRTFEAIQDHAYLLLGDPKELYKDVTGLLLYLNGAILFESDNKIDRHISKERSIELLKKGYNLLIYPEGAWNITDSVPVLQLFPGTIKIALETGADIVPVAIEQYDQSFFVNIGKNMNLCSLSYHNIDELNSYLRNCLATLKWEIWKSRSTTVRENITSEFIENYKQNIVDKCEYGFTIEDVYRTMYKDSSVVSPNEAFAFQKKLNIKNGFPIVNNL